MSYRKEQRNNNVWNDGISEGGKVIYLGRQNWKLVK